MGNPYYHDAYYGLDGLSSILFWVVLFGIGWIIKIVTKTGSVGENAALAMMIVIALVMVFGFGRAFIFCAQEYPLPTVAAVAFYLWDWKRSKNQK